VIFGSIFSQILKQKIDYNHFQILGTSAIAILHLKKWKKLNSCDRKNFGNSHFFFFFFLNGFKVPFMSTFQNLQAVNFVFVASLQFHLFIFWKHLDGIKASSNVRIKCEGCRLRNGGCSIKSKEWRVICFRSLSIWYCSPTPRFFFNLGPRHSLGWLNYLRFCKFFIFFLRVVLCPKNPLFEKWISLHPEIDYIRVCQQNLIPSCPGS
jgi:hypothetical protein